MTEEQQPISNKPPCRQEDATKVLMRLRDAGHVAYFAGGCVRDMLLGLEPKDWDIATDAPPDEVRQLFRNTQAVGAAFGVILVRQGPSQVEVATFRTDLSYEDGRRPTGVKFTTAEEDAKRRDFTINGLFFDPVEERVIDYVGGYEDLRRKWIRAIGDADQRFAEDHLRLLRAVRFSARLGFEIHTDTANAIRRHAEQLVRISPERVGEELRLILTPTTRETAWQELSRLGLMPVIFRHLPEKWHGHQWHAGQNGPIFPVVEPGRPIPFGLALAAITLCYRAAAPSIELLERPEIRRSVQACRQAMKISNEDSELMEACLSFGHLLSGEKPSVASMKRFLGAPWAKHAREMLHAVGLRWTLVTDRVRWLEEQMRQLEQTDIAPPPLITGDDLTAAGLQPGKLFKALLDQVYDAQLEDRVGSKEEALKLALDLGRQSR